MRFPHQIGLASVFAICAGCSTQTLTTQTVYIPPVGAAPYSSSPQKGGIQKHLHVPPPLDCNSSSFIYSVEDIFLQENIHAQELIIDTCNDDGTASVSGHGLGLTGNHSTYALTYQQSLIKCPEDGPVWRTVVGTIPSP